MRRPSTNPTPKRPMVWIQSNSRVGPVPTGQRLIAVRSAGGNWPYAYSTQAGVASEKRKPQLARKHELRYSSAPRPGLEPGTLGLEGRCSIQLSYRGIAALKGLDTRAIDTYRPKESEIVIAIESTRENSVTKPANGWTTVALQLNLRGCSVGRPLGSRFCLRFPPSVGTIALSM